MARCRVCLALEDRDRHIVVQMDDGSAPIRGTADPRFGLPFSCGDSYQLSGSIDLHKISETGAQAFWQKPPQAPCIPWGGYVPSTTRYGLLKHILRQLSAS